MKIGIIGAGISGMSAALTLAQRGHEVDVFQREGSVGGLIATFDFDGVRIEHFYHFLCATDHGYFALADALGLRERVRFVPARTGFYYQGTCYPFSGALDLLRFRPIPFSQRLRFGVFALEARWRTEWQQLDAIAAKPWLIDRLGYRAYHVIWDPLLRLKFGEFHEHLSAAWVWHRIHRVAKSKGKLGYLEGGTGLLLDTLAAKLNALGVRLHASTPVRQITAHDGAVSGLTLENDAHHACDRVVSTVPLPVLAGLLPDGWEDYAAQLRRVQYIGVVCVLFKLRRRVSPYFWLNVHDSRVPFNGIIEYTNLNPLGGEHGHLVYVPYYVPTNHPLYTANDADIVAQSWQALRILNPQLTDADCLGHHVARTPYAQAICPVGFLNMLPDTRAPLAGLHLLDSTFLYPEDRTQSGHVTRAWACARDIDA